jgi:hypothetical protein
MIISHSKKFIFIHIYKVAGTSISSALRKYNYLPSKKNKLKSTFGVNPSIYSRDFDGHITARELSSKIPASIFGSYFKFAFVRNPWDWQVSLYHFGKQLRSHHQHHLFNNMTFREYLDWRVNEDLKLQSDFILSDDGKMLVDYVGRLESINQDFSEICESIGLDKDYVIPRLNRSNHSEYRKYYDSESKQIIQQAFRKDIEIFGYSF